MNLQIDPAEFAPIIKQAVDAAIRRLLDERPADGDGRILLNKKGAAEVLSASQSTVDRWRREEGLPFVKLDGLVLFRPEALRNWAASKEAQS